MVRRVYWMLLLLVVIVACRTKKYELKSEDRKESSVSAQTAAADPAAIPQSSRKEESKSQSENNVVIRRMSDMAQSKMCKSLFSSGRVLAQQAAYSPPIQESTEQYDVISENGFHTVTKDPLSTFSIDVDAASYANVRRFINGNQLPPKDAVRIEELINYFPYNYEAPTGSDPVAIAADIADCPWNKKHQLVRIGLKGREIKTEKLPPSNLVFLIDVSGSMTDQNKLPLLKSAFRLLVKELRKQDKVSMVVYAGQAGLVLPPTSGNEKEKIINALSSLEAGGSTAGGAGIQLAYETAKRNLLKDGNNRVILATDGDFNVGVSNDDELVRMIEEKRKEGIFLTVLGFGMGNFKDSKMEKLADKGNGNYAYIDNLLEAKKVLVSEMGATLHTIAKDVKVQVEFNPGKVQAYRLIGYENRLLAPEDFNNDKKDAGEMGAGSTVTALYEVVPTAITSDVGSVDPLKYQKAENVARTADSDEWLTVKFRYKEPKGETSKMVAKPVLYQETALASAPENFRFAVAVAGFGMILRGSEFKDDLSYEQVISMAKKAIGEDPEGYRAEFVKLAKACQAIESSQQAVR